ncbi:MAG: hypothetical protein ACLT98_05360 [Eggerthellaceae bacterium]
MAQANDALVERLYALFPTEDAAHRTILKPPSAGASIEAPPPGRRPAATLLRGRSCRWNW